jgi:hypothetical protein
MTINYNKKRKEKKKTEDEKAIIGRKSASDGYALAINFLDIDIKYSVPYI